jgi:hypothetical protein
VGAHNLGIALLWIWRDLFLSMLANASKADRKNIPAMLTAIVDEMDWRALEGMIYGGKRGE